MEGLKDLVVKLVGKAYNKPAEEITNLIFKKDGDAEVINEDALDKLLELDKAKVQSFETEKKNLYDKGYKKAQAESLSKFEKDIRDKFQITEEKQGIELIEAVVSAKSQSGTGEVDEEKIKSSKLYNDTIANLKKEKEAVIKEWTEKYDGREKQLQKEATFKTISEKAVSFVKSLNPILPEDQKKAENQLNILINQVKDFEYEVKDDGKIIVWKEGKVVTDDHGHPRSFEDLVKDKASSLWDFKKGEERSGTGNNHHNAGAAGTGNKGYSGPIPKTEAEYQKMVSELPDEAAQIALTKAYVGQKSS